MSCLQPLKIRNPRYVNMEYDARREYSLRVYGVSTPPNMFISIPCGRCLPCLKRKLHGYRMRLLCELKVYPRSIFVTLTFDEPSLRRFENNANKSLLLFLDRVRKKYGNVRHWFVAEYGKKRGRLHYHGILFNCTMTNEELQKLWKYGNTFVGYANEITAKYIVKYLTKYDTKEQNVAPRVVSSKGIGISWLSSPECRLLKSRYATCLSIGGKPVPLPRFYLDKMYDERDKEIISYYSYMENFQDRYFVGGKEYYSLSSAEVARKQLLSQYKRLGLHSNYLRRKRGLSASTRYQIMLDTYLQHFKPFDYVTNSNSFQL